MTCFGPFFVLLNTSHPGFFISMHVCCYAPRDLMGQGETVLQGECTVTCPKGHSIRFDGISPKDAPHDCEYLHILHFNVFV